MRIEPLPSLNRCQQKVTNDDGSFLYRCRAPHNPVWFLGNEGLLLPVDVGNLASAQSKVGGMILRGRNIRTVGIREDLKAEKFLGIRKDDDQEGKEQLEMGLISLKVNNLEGSFIPSSVRQDNLITQSFGAFKVQSTRQFTRFYIPYDGQFDSFELKLFIHSTGLEPEYREDLNEFWFLNNAGELFARFVQPDIFDASGEKRALDKSSERLIDHRLEPAKDGWIYTKFSTKHLTGMNIPLGSLIDGSIFYGHTNDGWMGYTNAWNGADWGVAQSAATGDTGPYTTGQYAVQAMQATKYYVGHYALCRAFLIFECAYLTNVTAGTMTFYKHSFSGVRSNSYAGIGTQAVNLTLNDFRAFQEVSYLTTNAHYWTDAPASYTGTLTASARAAINNNYSKVVFRPACDVEIVPADGEDDQLGLRFTDYTGTTYDPYLDLTGDYTPPGWSHIFNDVSSPGSAIGIGGDSIDKIVGV